jgi:hypothetical protein
MRQAERVGLLSGIRSGGAVLLDLRGAIVALQKNGPAFETVTIFILLVALWLITRPFIGIAWDAQFYAVQALHAISPERFSQDLFFKYGSQDEFSIFSAFYKPFILWFGLARGNELLTIFDQCLWFGGLVYLVRTLFKDRLSVALAVAAVIVLPSNLDLLQSAEPFLTPRPYAEALTLFALGNMLRERPVRAGALLLLAMALHPLMALPGVAVFWCYQSLKSRFWLIAGLAAALLMIGLALAGVQPFVRLFDRFDPAWLRIVEVRDYFCFLGRWTLGYWLPVCTTCCLVVLGMATASATRRQLLMISLLVAVAGFVLSYIGGDLFHDVLILDLQTWRAGWLVTVIAHIVIGPMVLSIPRRGASYVLTAKAMFNVALGFLALSGFFISLTLLTVLPAGGAAIAFHRERLTQAELSTPYKLLNLALIVLMTFLSVLGLRVWLSQFAYSPGALEGALHGFLLAAGTLLVFAFCIRGLAVGGRPRFVPPVLLAVSLGLLALAMSNWDQRSAWTKFLDTSAPPPALTALLPGDAPIYWEGDVSVPWFLLRRASYFSCQQGTGVLFSRGTAMSYQRRYETFVPLHVLDIGQYAICPALDLAADQRGTPDKRPRLPPSKAQVVAVCREDPGLGALVLIHPVAGLKRREWKSPVPYGYTVYGKHGPYIEPVTHFFIYPCGGLR